MLRYIKRAWADWELKHRFNGDRQARYEAQRRRHRRRHRIPEKTGRGFEVPSR